MAKEGRALVGVPAMLIGSILLLTFIYFRQVKDGFLLSKAAAEVPIDLWIYRQGGAFVINDHTLYHGAYAGDLPFTYPPFAAWVFRLLVLPPDVVLAVGWRVGIIAAVLAVFLLCLKERKVPLTPSVIGLATVLSISSIALGPIHGGMYFGQIGAFLMLLISLDFLPNKFRLPGIGVGLAAGMKLTPAFMGLIFLLEKRWWAAVGSVVTFGITVIIGLITVKDAPVFWTEAMWNSSRVGDHANLGAQSLKSMLVRDFGVESELVWLASALLVLALVSAATACALRHDNRTLALAFTGIGSCLVSPFSWFHHWVWILPLSFALMVWLNRQLATRFGPSTTGLASLLAVVALTLPFIDDGMGLEIDSQYYTVFGIVVLCVYLLSTVTRKG